MSEVTEILQSHKQDVINELTSSLVATVPMYAIADPVEVRERVELLFG